MIQNEEVTFSRRSGGTRETPAIMSSAKTILIIEDDADIRDALIGILGDEGYAATGVANGLEGLQYLRAKEAPALILLDLMMPVMNGWQFRAEQRGDPALASIPVVVISADGNVRTKASTIEAAGFLKKPIELEVLLRVVQQHCGA